MAQANHKTDFGAWLRRTWNALMCAVEGLDRSPMEDVVDRLDRLDRLERLERQRHAPVASRRSPRRTQKV